MTPMTAIIVDKIDLEVLIDGLNLLSNYESISDKHSKSSIILFNILKEELKQLES